MTWTPCSSPRRATAAARGLVLALCITTSLTAQACEIPVYQYALENWETDEYEVTVFHRGPMSAADRDAVGLLRESADYGAGHGNLTVETVDLAANPDAIMLQRWRDQAGAKLPWMAASYPRHTRVREPAWAGPLSEANVRALLDSPLRRKIAGELTSRVTAVWVLLESGNRGKDNAAATLLERELKRLEETLVLPELEAWGTDAGTTEPEEVRFTLHRLSRDSEEERMFVNMLLRSERDLVPKFDREPLVFPMYGRGLILYALAGPGINEWTIMKAAEFVTGSCSCEVKAGNPGTDMLLTLDWDAHVKQTAQERMPPPTGMASFQDRAAEAERRLAEVDEAAAADVGSTTPRAMEGAGAPAGTTEATSRRLGVQGLEASDAKDAQGASSTEAAQPPTGEGKEESEVAQDPAAVPVAEPEVDDEAQHQAAVAHVDAGTDDGGVAGGVGVLALIAGAVTVALMTAVVLRRRRIAVRDGEHERIPT